MIKIGNIVVAVSVISSLNSFPPWGWMGGLSLPGRLVVGDTIGQFWPVNCEE